MMGKKGILWGRLIYLGLLFGAIASTCQHKVCSMCKSFRIFCCLSKMDFNLGGYVGLFCFFPHLFVWAQFFL